MRKIAVVVAAMFVLSFALERVDNLRSHRGFTGPSAFAQDADDSAEAPDTQTPNVG